MAIKQKNITDKPSFIIYKNFYEPIKSLSMEDRGKLFTAIFEYQINNTEIKLPDSCKMAFMFFKNQFNLDFDKWLGIVDRNVKNGRTGGRKSKPKKPNGFQSPPNNPIAPETETETETETVNEIEEDNIYNEQFNEFWELYTPIRDSKGDWVAKGSKKECKKKFIKIMLEGVSYGTVINSLKQYLEYCKAANRQSCGAEVFINQRRWENDYSCGQTVDANKGTREERQKTVSYLEIAARAKERFKNRGKDDIY